MDVEKQILYDCTMSAPEMSMLNKKITIAQQTAPGSKEVVELVHFVSGLVNKAFRVGVAQGRTDAE